MKKQQKEKLKKVVQEAVVSELNFGNLAQGPMGIVRGMIEKAIEDGSLPDLEVSTGADETYINLDYRIKIPHHGNKELARKALKFLAGSGKTGKQGGVLRQLLRFISR